MSASEVAPNPFWYAKPTAALTSRDRLSIGVIAMFVSQSTNPVVGIRKSVKPPACLWPAAVPDPDGLVSLLKSLLAGSSFVYPSADVPRPSRRVGVQLSQSCPLRRQVTDAERRQAAHNLTRHD